MSAAAKPGEATRLWSMIDRGTYGLPGERPKSWIDLGEAIRALAARAEAAESDWQVEKARAEKAEAKMRELKAWAAWATKRLKADIKRRAALRVKP